MQLSNIPKNKRYSLIARIFEKKGILHFCEAAKALHLPEREFTVLKSADKWEQQSLDILKHAHQQVWVNVKTLTTNLENELKDCFCYLLPSWYSIDKATQVPCSNQ